MRMNFWQSEPSPVVEGTAETASVGADLVVSAKAERYDSFTRWVLYVGLFLLPIFFLPWTTSVLELSKQTLLVGMAGLGLITWLLGIVISGQIKFRTTILDRAVVALLIGTAAASLFSVSRGKSLFGLSISLSESLITVLALSISYFLMVNVFDDRGRKLRTVLLSSLTLVLMFGLLQMFSVYVLDLSFTRSRAFNTVGSLNTLGLLAAIALPLFIKSRISIPRIPFVDIAKVGAVAGIAVLVILNWWVLWTVAIAGMVSLIAFDSVSLALSSRSGERFNLSRFLMPMVVIVLGVFLMVVGFNLDAVKKNFPVEISPSFNLSTQVAKGALSENLLTGYGPENFSLAFDKYGARALANSTLSNLKFYDGTSQIINFITSGGILMALAILFMVGTVTYVLWRFKEHVSSGVNAHEASGVFASMVAVTLGLFLYSFNTTLMFTWYSLLAMTSLVLWGGPKRVVNIEDRPAFSLASSLGFIGGLIGVLTGVYFITIHYLADVDFAKAQLGADTSAVAGKIVAAINWYPSDRYYREASQVSLTMLTEELRSSNRSADRAARIQNLIISSRDLAIQATRLEPRESNNWFNLGSIYESLIGLVENADTLAEEAYNEAASLRPGDASFANRIGSMYLGKAELQRQLARSAGVNADRFLRDTDAALLKAEDSFKQAIETSSNYGLAIYNLAAVYDRQGKITDAIKQIEKIAPFNAQDPNLMFQLGLLYYRAGRKDDSFNALQQAVFLSPSFANARWYLGLLFEERNDFPNAIAHMEKILENNKDNDIVIKKIENLRKGISAFPPGSPIDEQPL